MTISLFLFTLGLMALDPIGVPPIRPTYLHKQWAAVTKNFSLIIVAPQK